MIVAIAFVAVLAVVVVGVTAGLDRVDETRQRPTARDGSSPGGGWAQGAKLRMAFPLARAEVGRLVRHPLSAVGIGLTALATWGVFGRGGDLSRDGAIFGLIVWPFAGMMLIATNLAASRPRRHGTDELFDSLPGTREARTLGHAVSLVGPMLVVVAMAGVLFVYGRLSGGTGSPPPVEIAIGVVLVGCAGAVGLLLDRLTGRAMLAVPVVIGIGILEGNLASDRVPLFWHQLAPWTPVNELPTEVWVRPSGWHLIYLVGIGAVLVGVAVLRHRRSRRAVAAVIAAVAVAAGAGWAQIRLPTRAQIEASAAFIGDPGSVQRCQQRGNVGYCHYPEREHMVAQWRRAVDGVLDRVPPHVRERSLKVAQRVRGIDLQQLEPEIAAALPFTVPSAQPHVWPDDGAIHPDMRWCGRNELGSCEVILAAQVAGWAVGFPFAPVRSVDDDPETPLTTAYDSSGQARAVVALWLAGASTPRTAHELRPQASPGPEEPQGSCVVLCDAKASPSFRIAFCDGVDEASVEYWPAEIAYARTLLRLPSDRVAPTLLRHWDRLVDPRTKTATLASLFGLPDPSRELFAHPAVSGC